MPHIGDGIWFVVYSSSELLIIMRFRFRLKCAFREKKQLIRHQSALQNIFNEKALKYLGHDKDFYLRVYLFLLTYVSWDWWSSLIVYIFWMLHRREFFFNAFSFLLYDTKTLLDGIWSIVQSSQGYCICKGVCKLHFIALNDLRCSALHMHLFCGKYVCVCVPKLLLL